MNGIEGIRRIQAAWPDVSPVILTVYDDDERILEALCAGANGYLLKNTPPVGCWRRFRTQRPVGRPCLRRSPAAWWNCSAGCNRLSSGLSVDAHEVRILTHCFPGAPRRRGSRKPGFCRAPARALPGAFLPPPGCQDCKAGPESWASA